MAGADVFCLMPTLSLTLTLIANLDPKPYSGRGSGGMTPTGTQTPPSMSMDRTSTMPAPSATTDFLLRAVRFMTRKLIANLTASLAYEGWRDYQKGL